MPTAKQYEQAVSYMVGQLHVSLSDAEVKAHVCSKFKKGLSKQTIAAACRAAVRVHAKNKKLYQDVMGGRFNPLTPREADPRKTVRATRRPNQADRLGNPMLTRAAANQILDGVYGNFDQALHFAKSQAGPFWRQVEVELHHLAEETARPLVRGLVARRAPSLAVVCHAEIAAGTIVKSVGIAAPVEDNRGEPGGEKG